MRGAGRGARDAGRGTRGAGRLICEDWCDIVIM